MEIGKLMVDTRDGRTGVVMGRQGPYVQLRPPQGGVEWDVPPERLREGGGEMRLPRAVVRQVNWTLEPDREPDAEPTTYAMQCAVCEETSAAEVDFGGPQEWVLAHGGRNPSHHSYREVIVRPWRAWWRG